MLGSNGRPCWWEPRSRISIPRKPRSPPYRTATSVFGKQANTNWRPNRMASKHNSVDRRRFLKGTAAGAVAAGAAAMAPPRLVAQAPSNTPPTMSRAAETQTPPAADALTADHPGSDFMVDIVKSLGIEYICANPGSSFRGLHESLVNYGGNKDPELITCCHEEASVAMAHGYAKIEGKPIGVMLHGPVGLQHAAMAIYNAYCDRAPIVLLLGNALDATQRRPGVEWVHSAPDAAAMVRDFVKWDDVPLSLTHFAESTVRGYKIAMTPPMMPVLIVADGDLQEHAIEPGQSLHVPRLPVMAPPQGDSAAVNEAARMLVAAQSPVLVADRL